MTCYLYLLIFAWELWNPPSYKNVYHISIDEMCEKMQLDKDMEELQWVCSDILR